MPGRGRRGGRERESGATDDCYAPLDDSELSSTARVATFLPFPESAGGRLDAITS